MKPLLAYCTTFKPNVTCYNNNASLLIETLCGTAVLTFNKRGSERECKRENHNKKVLSLSHSLVQHRLSVHHSINISGK